MPWFVYILECGDKTLYTGYTNDLEKRLKTHDAGKGARYTRGRGPFVLRHSEAFETKSAAMSREWHIKQLPKSEKLRLASRCSGP